MNEHKRLCKNAASRNMMASKVRTIAEECGAVCTMREGGTYSPRATKMNLAKGPWRCMLDFDGDSRVGAFLGHWYHEGDGAETLPPHFDLTIRGSENPYHRRRATTCAVGFDDFLTSIKAGLLALQP